MIRSASTCTVEPPTWFLERSASTILCGTFFKSVPFFWKYCGIAKLLLLGTHPVFVVLISSCTSYSVLGSTLNNAGVGINIVVLDGELITKHVLRFTAVRHSFVFRLLPPRSLRHVLNFLIYMNIKLNILG